MTEIEAVKPGWADFSWVSCEIGARAGSSVAVTVLEESLRTRVHVLPAGVLRLHRYCLCLLVDRLACSLDQKTNVTIGLSKPPGVFLHLCEPDTGQLVSPWIQSHARIFSLCSLARLESQWKLIELRVF